MFKLFSILTLPKLKTYGLALILAIGGFFIGRKVGWIKALRWAAMKYKLEQAKEGLRNAETRKKIEHDIDQLDDDELDRFLLTPDKPKHK